MPYHVGFLSDLLAPFATLRSLLEAGGSTSKMPRPLAGYRPVHSFCEQATGWNPDDLLVLETVAKDEDGNLVSAEDFVLNITYFGANMGY